MPQVFITDCGFETPDIERAILEPLGCEVVRGQCTDPDELVKLLADKEYVLTVWAPLNAKVIAAMNRAKVIVRYGIGVDAIDLEAAAQRHLPVCNVPDYCIDEVADHTVMFMLALTRQTIPNWDVIRGGDWKLAVPLEEMKTMKDLTIGLAGFGRIGREVAVRLRSFHCQIHVYDPVVAPEVITQAGCVPVSWNDLLAGSDLLSLHLPSTAKTRGLIDRAALARMKKGALFVNVSRGTLVKTDDLVAALREGRLAGAGLDVTDPEPLPADSPLRKMPHVIISAHVASASANAARKLRTSAAQTIACAVRGDKIPNVVNGVR